MADSTSFTVGIAVQASGVSAAADQVSVLAKQLDAATAASTAAADAVKKGQTAYNQAESAFNRASAAVEKLGALSEAQKGKLAKALEAGDASGAARAAAALQALGARQAEATEKVKTANAAMLSQAAALDKLKASAAGAAASQAKVVSAQDSAKNAAKAVEKAQAAAAGSGKVNEIAEGFGKLGGPLGSVGQKAFGAAEGLKKLTASLGSAGPYAAIAVVLVAVAAAVTAVAAAAVAATASVAAWAVSLADAARTNVLLTAGIAKSVEGGEELTRTIEGLTAQVPLTSAELLQLAKPLADAGLKGAELSSALEEAAVKAATVKFGPNFAKQLSALPVLATRIQASFSRIFSGLKIEPILAALESFASLFDKGMASANAISVVFESLFQPLVDGAAQVLPKLRTGFIEFQILVMQALILIKPYRAEILLVAQAFGIMALAVGGIIALAFGAVLAAFSAQFALIAAVGTAVIATIISFKDSIVAAGLAAVNFGAGIISAVGGAIDFLRGLSLADIGTAMINGLVQGIVNAGPALLGAITGIASGAINAAKSALGIASPSKVFAEIGMNTAKGMSQGVEGESTAVQGSLESLVAPPAAAAAPATATASGSGGVFNITVNASGGDGASIAEAVRSVIQDLLTQAGGGVPA